MHALMGHSNLPWWMHALISWHHAITVSSQNGMAISLIRVAPKWKERPFSKRSPWQSARFLTFLPAQALVPFLLTLRHYTRQHMAFGSLI